MSFEETQQPHYQVTAIQGGTSPYSRDSSGPILGPPSPTSSQLAADVIEDDVQSHPDANKFSTGSSQSLKWTDKKSSDPPGPVIIGQKTYVSQAQKPAEEDVGNNAGVEDHRQGERSKGDSQFSTPRSPTQSQQRRTTPKRIPHGHQPISAHTPSESRLQAIAEHLSPQKAATKLHQPPPTRQPSDHSNQRESISSETDSFAPKVRLRPSQQRKQFFERDRARSTVNVEQLEEVAEDGTDHDRERKDGEEEEEEHGLGDTSRHYIEREIDELDADADEGKSLSTAKRQSRFRGMASSNTGGSSQGPSQLWSDRVLSSPVKGQQSQLSNPFQATQAGPFILPSIPVSQTQRSDAAESPSPVKHTEHVTGVAEEVTPKAAIPNGVSSSRKLKPTNPNQQRRLGMNGSRIVRSAPENSVARAATFSDSQVNHHTVAAPEAAATSAACNQYEATQQNTVGVTPAAAVHASRSASSRVVSFPFQQEPAIELPLDSPVPSRPSSSPTRRQSIPKRNVPEDPRVFEQPAVLAAKDKRSLPDRIPQVSHVSPARQYGKAGKRKRKRSTLNQEEFVTPDDLSDSSSSAPEDQEDFSFRPTVKAQLQAKAKLKRSRLAAIQEDGRKTRGSSRVSDKSDHAEEAGPSKKKARSGRMKANRLSVTSSERSEITDADDREYVPVDAHDDDEQGGVDIAPLYSTPPPRNDDPSANFIGPLVLANYHSTGWYVGRVISQDGPMYQIEYLDTDSNVVTAERIRACRFEADDIVKNYHDQTMKLRVTAPFFCHEDEGEDASLESISVVNTKGLETKIPLGDVVVSSTTINQRFANRMFDSSGLAIPFRHLQRKGVKGNSVASTTPRRPISGSRFEGLNFMFTSLSPGNFIIERYEQMTRSQGGMIVDSWQDLFEDITAARPRLKLGIRPFLLVEGNKSVLKPKLMVALAFGIPCLSLQFLEDAIRDDEVHWSSYLVSSGESRATGQWHSQIIDMNWAQHGWKAERAKNVRQPMAERRILFLAPKSSSETMKIVKELVPFCCRAMGSEVDVKPITNRELQISLYDAIVVDERDGEVVPADIIQSGRACDMGWLKQCLIMGSYLRPELLSRSEKQPTKSRRK